MLVTTIAVASLLVSLATAYLTFFRRGTVLMTQPTVIFLGPDGRRSRDQRPLPKVYLRALLFATSKRGCIIESLYVSLSRNETRQNFNIWVYGSDSLARGSGLFVGETGVEANHHFLAPRDADTFRFSAGKYRLEVYARFLGKPVSKRLIAQTLEIAPEMATTLERDDAGVYFDWGPDSSTYVPHIDTRPPEPSREDFLRLLHGLASGADK